MATETSLQRVPLAGRRRRRWGDLALRGITGLAAVILAVVMVLLVYEVAHQAWPSIQEFGVGFLTSTEWNAVTNEFGARDLIWGTLITSLGALLIAVPMSIAIGVFLSELAPRSVRAPVTTLVELLAAIPSVVLGLWGILVMGPFVAEHIEPFFIDHFGWIPFMSGYPSNQGLFPAILVLTIMVVPIVASISRELFTNVPSDLKQGSLALGATRWEMVRSVMIPQVSGGLVAAVMLGFGRAIGEAIAVTQVIGGANVRPDSLWGPADTMASRIAAQYAGTPTSLARASLAYLAVILLIISLFTNVTAQVIAARIQRKMRGHA
jgi:phosphate transport system permease protein